jgi:hypothetical protein
MTNQKQRAKKTVLGKAVFIFWYNAINTVNGIIKYLRE